MTGTADVEGLSDGGGTLVADPLATLAPAEQVFASVEPGAFVLGELPPEAFENLLVVTAGRSPSAVERVVRDRGHEPRTVGVVPISGDDVDYDGPMWCADRVSPHDLTGISIRFGEGFRYVKPDEGWVLFDNLTVLLMYAESGRLFQLLNSVVGKVRSREARGVYPIVRDATADETYQQFRSLFDRTVDLR